jgi:hypothetical protein
VHHINPLSAELNPICHLLGLLGDLTFMDSCIVSIFQYISNKIQRYTVYLYLETTVHVSGSTSTHYQERILLYLQHLVFVIALLLSAAIVEELELVWVCCGWRAPPTVHSNHQIGAQFILSIFINLYMFWANMGPSSGKTTVYMRHLVLVILRGWLVCRVESTLHTRQSSIQITSNKCHIYTVVFLDDGPIVARNL